MLYYNKYKFILIGFVVYIISYILLYKNFNENKSKYMDYISITLPQIVSPYWMIIESKQSCNFLRNQYPSWRIFIYNKNSNKGFNTTDNCMYITKDIFLSFIKEYNLFSLSKILQIFLFSIKNGAQLIYHKIDNVFDDIDYLKEVIQASRPSRKLSYILKNSHTSNSICNISMENVKYCNYIASPVIYFYSFYSPIIHSIYSNKSINYYAVKGLAYGDNIKLDLRYLSKPVYSTNIFLFLGLFYLQNLKIDSLYITKKELITFIIELNLFEKYIFYVYYKSYKKISKCQELNKEYSTNLTKLYKFMLHKENIDKEFEHSLKNILGILKYNILLLWKESLNKLIKSNLVEDSLIKLSSNSVYNCYDFCISSKNISNQKYINTNYNSLCSDNFKSILSTNIDINNPPFAFSNLLLIIVFNNAHYEVIPVLEILYQSRFHRIIYCGPYLPNNLTKNIHFLTFDYKPVDEVEGAYNYECTIKAIEIGFKVDGYLTIADDLLLFADISKFPLNQIWFQPVSLIHTFDYELNSQCKKNECIYLPRWRWFLDYKQQVLKLLDDMKNSKYWLIERCSNDLIKFNDGAKSRIHGAYADIFYIPNKYSLEFVELGHYFLDHKIFLEIAIPTIIICLLQNNYANLAIDNLNYKVIKGMEIWEENRNFPWLYWEKVRNEGVYLHPTKWSHILNYNDHKESKHKTINISNSKNKLNSNWSNFLCDNVIPFMYSNI